MMVGFKVVSSIQVGFILFYLLIKFVWSATINLIFVLIMFILLKIVRCHLVLTVMVLFNVKCPPSRLVL